MGRSTVAFFTEYAEQADSTEIVIPEDLSGLEDEALAALHTSAVEGFNALYGEDGTGLSAEALDALSVLTEGIERVQGEVDARKAAADARTEKAAALAAKVGVAPVEPAALSAEGEDADEDADDVEGAAEESFAAKASTIRVNLAGLASRTRKPAPEPMATDGPKTMADIVKASTDFQGFAAGQGLTWSDIGRGLDRRLAAVNRSQWEQAGAAGRHMRTQMGMAVIQKPFAADLVLTSSDPVHVDEILQRASKESRLPQGSLVASGGWCAPSETIYDLCELETRDGIFTAPEIGVTRGGIKFTPGPNFADIYNGSGFHYTEDQDEAGDYDGAGGGSKPCYVVDCPDFTEKRLDYDGVCINAGLLMQRGYPEVIARTVRGALVAHDHKVAAAALASIATGSTAVTMPADQIGATAPVLSAIELQVEHMRTVGRLARGTSVEAVFPFWVRGAIRADLSRRLGVDLLSVSDARIDGWFRERGVAPQFVYGLPGMDPTGAPGSFVQWPGAVTFLLYPAGTWVRGTSDIITLDTIYDSVQLGTNDFTALFTEEGSLMAKLCHDSRKVTVDVCASGLTGGGVEIGCDGTYTPLVTTP
jgi:hypothetical protein